MRGKATVGSIGVYTVRIIPAGAGKSHLLFGLKLFVRDHPRGCGEKRSGAISVPA